MIKHDRFLLVVVLVIAALVIAALTLFFIRRGDQQYGPEDTPEGVVRNYVLALQKGDYERSYAYLSDDDTRPGFEEYQNDLLVLNRELAAISIQLGETNQTGEKALVSMTLLHSAGGPFADIWREANNALLIKDATGAWKIARMPYPFWGAAWYPVKSPNP